MSLMSIASTAVNECALCGAKDVEVMGCFVPGQSEAERYWPTKGTYPLDVGTGGIVGER